MARFALIVIFAAIATSMFVIKNKVIALESDLDAINAQITEDRKAIHVLNAEWSYLNDPERIRSLSARHARMKPVRGEQIISLSAIPFKKSAEPLSAKDGFIRVSYTVATRE